MAGGVSLQLPYELGVLRKYGQTNKFKSSDMRRSCCHLPRTSFSSCSSRQDFWSSHVTNRMHQRLNFTLSRSNLLTCRCSIIPSSLNGIPILKSTALSLERSYIALRGSPVAIQLAPAIGIIAFAVWGLEPLMRSSRHHIFHRIDHNWKKSKTYYIFTSYLQPLLLWSGAILICRAIDPVILPSEASQAVKQRLLNFVRSLSTVLAFAYCLTSLIKQTQKIFMEKSSSDDTRNMGFQFAGRAVYTAVWVAAFSLFMELLGFSTQKWVTAGGLGTVLLTLAGREIFTNFLSSVMIHAARPFVQNEWIQTKIEGYEVSGTVEHVGWWSPTIIRGDDREAIHIPNHKFTVNVIRNLTQKTHWRIKTHLAISHLDVNKISNIVADMRKVISKNPQIEQQRLHRRVFLENINPENQALLILISCFVKTSHFEEYLRVKEAILLDLLRVISHHRARLATPIRTVQKYYGDADVENIPFSDSMFTRGGSVINRPLLLIEPPQRINADDKSKLRTTPKSNEEQSSKTTTASEPKPTTVTKENSSGKQQQKKATSGDTRSKGDPSTVSPSNSPTNSETLSEQADIAVPTAVKNESERQVPPPSPSLSRPAFEDNIVLGVALEGSKRTLPIEEGVGSGPAPAPAPLETSEVGAGRSGNGSSPNVKDRKSQVPGTTGATANEKS